MKNKTRLTLTALFLTFCAIAQSANENLFKKMITNLPNYQSVPGTKRILTIHEFNTAKPVNWTMEYGNNPGADKNTKVYKAIAGFTLATETYNTQSGKIYSSSSKEYKRAYNFYIDKTQKWVCVPLGISAGLY